MKGWDGKLLGTLSQAGVDHATGPPPGAVPTTGIRVKPEPAASSAMQIQPHALPCALLEAGGGPAATLTPEQQKSIRRNKERAEKLQRDRHGKAAAGGGATPMDRGPRQVLLPA